MRRGNQAAGTRRISFCVALWAGGGTGWLGESTCAFVFCEMHAKAVCSGASEAENVQTRLTIGGNVCVL